MVEIILYYLPVRREDGEQGHYSTGLRHGFFIPPHDGKGSLNWIGPSLDEMIKRLQQEVTTIPQRKLFGVDPSNYFGYEPLSQMAIRQVENALNGQST